MRSEFIKKIELRLLKEKEDIENAICSKQLEVDNDGDDTDKIQGMLLHNVNKNLVTRDKDKIFKINKALNKIHNNSYGSCEECGEDIPEKRLLFNPYFQDCVSCAEQKELERKLVGKHYE